jgi:hypothetical protein
LTITSVTGNTPVNAGGSLNGSATVINQGNSAASAFRIGFYLSSDVTITSSDTFLGLCSVASLSAGSSTNCSRTLTVPQVSGTYYLGAIADDQNVISETSETNNALASSSITINGPVPTIGWEFNSLNNFEGWSASNISAAAVHDGALFIDPSGSDPQIVSPAISISASAYRTIVVRIASNGLDPFGNIYFKTANENFFSADKRVEFSVQNCSLCGNAATITYTINMTSNSKWSGTITGIRIDPANDGKSGTNTDSMLLDFVRITP